MATEHPRQVELRQNIDKILVGIKEAVSLRVFLAPCYSWFIIRARIRMSALWSRHRALLLNYQQEKVC